jgi:DNA-binding transcriptional LysR family regulator
LRQLRYFAAVAEHGSFSRAATEIQIAQSALSQQVLKLEAELGVRLLHRGARAVELTEAGTVVLERAHRLAADADALVAEVDALRGLVRGRLTIGGVPPIGGVQAARIIASFARRHPAIEVRVREDAAPRLIEELRQGALDVVLALVDVETVPSDVEGVVLIAEELVAVLPPTHPLAARGRVSLSALAREPLVSYAAGSVLADVLAAVVRAGGHEPRIAFQADDIQTVLEMVLEGLGCTVLPRGLAPTRAAVRPLSPEQSPIPVSMLWRVGPSRSPAASAFCQHVLDAIG